MKPAVEMALFKRSLAPFMQAVRAAAAAAAAHI